MSNRSARCEAEWVTPGTASSSTQRPASLSVRSVYSGHLNTGAGGFADLKSNRFETGYVVGAGLERALGANWSLKCEHQYIDVGDGKAEGPLFSHKGKPSGDAKADFDTDFHTVRSA